MSLSGGNSPLNEGNVAKTKKKINHNRVSMLNFSDEIMDQVANQDVDIFADCMDQPLVSKPSRRRSSMAVRRRSSVGGGSIITEKEQLRIAEMYKTVIQMSSENVRTVPLHYLL